MNKGKKLVFGASLLVGALAMTVPERAMALNNFTPACTKIDNTAHVDFKVGTIAQGADSTTATFYVGVKVNVAVATTDAADVTVYPGSADTLLHFRITNNGNAPQRYALSYVQEADTTPSPFVGGGNDSYNATDVTLSSATIASLAPDDYQDITISADTPLSQTDAQVAVYALKAQSQWVGNSANVTVDGTATGANIGGAVCGVPGPDVQNIDVVVGDASSDNDAARDGAHSARSAYKVMAANLTITKSSQVVYDPVNCSSYSPLVCPGTVRAIPGAVVEYTVAIANSATGTATNVTVKDAIPANLTFLADGYAAGKGVQVDADNLYGGVATALTNVGADDEGDYNVTNPGAVTVTGIQVGNGQTAYAKFRATIN